MIEALRGERTGPIYTIEGLAQCGLADHCEWKKLKSRTARTVRLTAT
jgi:hypothetical protein